MAERRIAFMGSRGANGESAVRALYGAAAPVLPCPTLQAVFEAVLRGEASGAVVPIDNSSAGPVTETYDLLALHPVTVVAAVELRIRHALLARKGTKLEQLRSVRSHPQALAQCAGFLRAHGLAPIVGPDTATCARELSENGALEQGAIAASIAAELYGLEIVAEGIEDVADNQTCFVALGEVPQIAGVWRTSLLAELDDSPGALHALLGPFARHAINLSRLTVRPVPPGWRRRFFLDLEGAASDPELAAALEEARGVSRSVRVLGSYPVLRPA